MCNLVSTMIEMKERAATRFRERAAGEWWSLAAAGLSVLAIALFVAVPGRLEAGARYGVGSLVNSFLPGHVGEAVRVGLFSRGLVCNDRLWVASGIPSAIGAARACLLAVLVLAAAGSGVLPAWTALAFAGVGCVAVVVSAWAGR